MSIAIRSFAKINLGLKIGPARADGFHELRTIYQTMALHDVVRVEVQPGSGIEIRCNDPRVPLDESNTCYKVAERVTAERGRRPAAKVQSITDREADCRCKAAWARLVQRRRDDARAGARAGTRSFPPRTRLRIAAEVGSDLPLFLIGGTVLGVGRGEEVYPLQDLPPHAPGGGDAAGRGFDAARPLRNGTRLVGARSAELTGAGRRRYN